jgi:hypothetical protein
VFFIPVFKTGKYSFIGGFMNGNIFQRAWNNLPLTPGERAFLKLLKGWLYTAIGVGLIAGAQYLTNNQVINWWSLAWIAGGAFALSLLMALDKWFTSQGDLPLSVATEAVTQRIQAALPGLIAQHIATIPQQAVAAPVATTQSTSQTPLQGTYNLANNPTVTQTYVPPQMQQVTFPPLTQPGPLLNRNFATAQVPAVTPTHQ